MSERLSAEYRLGFEEAREFFLGTSDPVSEARKYAEAVEVGGSDYARGWRLAAHATIWEHARELEGVV